MNPIMFKLFGLEIRWYTVLVTLGIVIAYLLVERESKKFDYPKDFIFDLGFYVIVSGIVGARLWYVLFNLDYYGKHIGSIFAMWEGGLAIHGGIIGGFIALVIYCLIKKVNILRTTDMIAPALLIAQAIGRWGNFFNSEAYGPITTMENLKSLKVIPAFVIKGMNIDGVYYHPTFFYESMWCIIGFILILLIRRYFKYIKVGQLSCFYFMWYGIGRLFVESLRTDSLMIGSYKVAQIVSIIGIGVGFILFVILCVNRKNNNYYRSE